MGMDTKLNCLIREKTARLAMHTRDYTKESLKQS
jgi:hypothetical protein